MCHKLYLGHRPITSYDLSYRDMLPGALCLRSMFVFVYGGNISSRLLEVSARVLQAICVLCLFHVKLKLWCQTCELVCSLDVMSDLWTCCSDICVCDIIYVICPQRWDGIAQIFHVVHVRMMSLFEEHVSINVVVSRFCLKLWVPRLVSHFYFWFCRTHPPCTRSCLLLTTVFYGGCLIFWDILFWRHVFRSWGYTHIPLQVFTCCSRWLTIMVFIWWPPFYLFCLYIGTAHLHVQDPRRARSRSKRMWTIHLLHVLQALQQCFSVKLDRAIMFLINVLPMAATLLCKSSDAVEIVVSSGFCLALLHHLPWLGVKVAWRDFDVSFFETVVSWMFISPKTFGVTTTLVIWPH